jgi:hypothetical protein
MWKEYAVEPACVVQSRETFRYLLSNFGTEHGRWIVRFPRTWKQQVSSALEASPLRDVDRSRVIEWLKVDKGRFFGAGGDAFSPDTPWLRNALAHHQSRPFEKILAVANPDSHADVVVPEIENDLGTCLACPHVLSVARNADAMVGAVAPLLAKATELLFIDPHFGPEARFLDFLATALQRVAKRAQKPSRIEYHFKATASAIEFEQTWKSKILRAIPAGLPVRFVAWDERPGGEQLHDRFVLVPFGGVSFSVGLDTGAPGQTTLVTRLSNAAHKTIWDAYQPATAAFDLAPSFPFNLSRPS